METSAALRCPEIVPTPIPHIARRSLNEETTMKRRQLPAAMSPLELGQFPQVARKNTEENERKEERERASVPCSHGTARAGLGDGDVAGGRTVSGEKGGEDEDEGESVWFSKVEMRK